MSVRLLALMIISDFSASPAEGYFPQVKGGHSPAWRIAPRVSAKRIAVQKFAAVEGHRSPSDGRASPAHHILQTFLRKILYVIPRLFFRIVSRKYCDSKRAKNHPRFHHVVFSFFSPSFLRSHWRLLLLIYTPLTFLLHSLYTIFPKRFRAWERMRS